MRGAAKDGDKVLVRLTKYPLPSKLNHHTVEGDARRKKCSGYSETASRAARIIRQFCTKTGCERSLTRMFCLKRSASRRKKIIPDGRLDLRDETIFTIDGPDAKDFDDAISLKRDGDGIPSRCAYRRCFALCKARRSA